MSLKDWADNGWLQRLDFDRSDIVKMLEAVKRDLDTARFPGLHPDWKFNIAYNAALESAAVALAAEGYRAAREQHHYKVLDSLRLTLAVDATLSRKLDLCRKKRNTGTYNQVGAVTEDEATEMIETAERLRDSILEWLRTRHPGLYPTGNLT